MENKELAGGKTTGSGIAKEGIRGSSSEADEVSIGRGTRGVKVEP